METHYNHQETKWPYLSEKTKHRNQQWILHYQFWSALSWSFKEFNWEVTSSRSTSTTYKSNSRWTSNIGLLGPILWVQHNELGRRRYDFESCVRVIRFDNCYDWRKSGWWGSCSGGAFQKGWLKSSVEWGILDWTLIHEFQRSGNWVSYQTISNSCWHAKEIFNISQA